MQKLSSILIASILVAGALAVIPIDNAYAGHVVTADTVGNAVTGIAITDDGTITDIDDGTVTFGEQVTIIAGDADGTNVFTALFVDVEDTDGVGAIGIGSQIVLRIETSTEGINQAVGWLRADATDVTVGSLDSDVIFQTALNGIATTALTLNADDATFADTITVTGTSELQGDISNSLGNVVIADTVDLGSATTGLSITIGGAISDINANVIINDIVDLGSPTTGINIDTAGVITDIDGNVVIAGTVDLGSAAAGIRITSTGAMIDINDPAVTIADGLTIGVVGAETFSIATGGTDTINIGTDNTAIDDINIGSPSDNFSIESDAFTVTDAGAVSGVTTLATSGLISASGGITIGTGNANALNFMKTVFNAATSTSADQEIADSDVTEASIVLITLIDSNGADAGTSTCSVSDVQSDNLGFLISCDAALDASATISYIIIR